MLLLNFAEYKTFTEISLLTFFPEGHGLGAAPHILAVVFLSIRLRCEKGKINQYQEETFL